MTMLTRAGLKMMDEYRNRVQLRRMLEQDDRMLSDIGLTRGDVSAALELPMTVDASTAAWEGSRLTLGLDRSRMLAPGEARALAIRAARPVILKTEGPVEQLVGWLRRLVAKGA